METADLGLSRYARSLVSKMNYPEWVTYFPPSASWCHNINQMLIVRSNWLPDDNTENLRFCFSMKHLETLNDLVTSKGNKMLGKKKIIIMICECFTKIFLQTSFDLGKRQNTFFFAGCSQPQRSWNYLLFQAHLQHCRRLLRATVWALVLAWALGVAHSHSKLQGDAGLHPGRPCTFQVSCMLLCPFWLRWSDGEDISMEGPDLLTGQSRHTPPLLYHPEQNCSGFTAGGAHLVFKFACKTHSSALAGFWFHV